MPPDKVWCKTQAEHEQKVTTDVQWMILREVQKMAGTQQELKDAIAGLKVAIQADVDQDKVVVTAVNALLEKLKALPGATDLTEEIQAVTDATAQLSGDNADVQAALDAAGSV